MATMVFHERAYTYVIIAEYCALYSELDKSLFTYDVANTHYCGYINKICQEIKPTQNSYA